MGLMTEAFKRVAAIKLAEFMEMYAEEVERRRKRAEEDDDKEIHSEDESATHAHLDFENPDLLDGAIIAKQRRFGFGPPDNPVVNRTGANVQDN